MRKKNIHHIVVGGIATNCWIYPLDNDNTGKQAAGFCACAVIDPGDEGSRIIAFLDQLKLVPSCILLTHGHFDHIGAAAILVSEYRKRQGQPILAFHAADAKYGNLPPPDQALTEGDSIGPFTVLHLPGHTPGSIGLWDKAAQVLFSGDTLFRGDYGRTDLPGGSEKQIFASLGRLFALDGGIQVYPGHGPVTSIGDEVRSQGSFL